MMRLDFLLIALNFLCFSGECAKILGVFPAPGYSQFILAEALMKGLANRGHEVTVICPYSPKEPIKNYRTILTENVRESDDGLDLFMMENMNLFSHIATTYQFGDNLTEETLKNEKVQQFLQSDETFDVVVIEQFFNEALKGFAAHFNAPLVMLCSQGATEWSKDYVGIPSLPAISAITYTSYTNEMSFFQRFHNLMGAIYEYYYKHFVVYPHHKKLMDKYFPNSIDFDQVIYNVSVMLLNSHATTNENELLPYNAIEIGGFHISEKPLSQELQQFLDSAKDGAILFSLGSNLRSTDLTEETRKALFKIFGNLKQKIIWKFEQDFPDHPPNVWMGKWLNQSDILAHPNVQLFITHGGLLSTTEAVFNGVPMIGIPIFGDQKMNMARAVKNGIAIVLPYPELSEDSLAAAITEVINNVKYRENARRLSNLMRDRVVRPLDLAMYWIEYVVRHRGFFLPTAASKLTWIQIYCVDILVLVIFVLYLIKSAVSRRYVQQRSVRKRNKQKKQ